MDAFSSGREAVKAAKRRAKKRETVEEARQRFLHIMSRPNPPRTEKEMLQRMRESYGPGIAAWLLWQLGSVLIQAVAKWLWNRYYVSGVASSEPDR